MKKSVFIFLISALGFVVSCGGGDDTDVGFQPVAAPKSVAEAIKMADQKGTLPSLNRDATVSGPDMNANGVRDDIDTYIASLADTPPQKAALRQISSAIGNAMTINISDQSALLAASKRIADASACTHTRYDSATSSMKNTEMEKLTVNTKIRFKAYEKFSAAISGTTFVLPEGDGCAN